MSEKVGKISTALGKAQKKMGKAVKSSANPFFKSKYADLTACIDAVLPALNSEGIALFQGSEYDVEHRVFFVTTMLIHSSGEFLKNKMFVPITKNDAQGVGAAQTYGRRFSLASVCGLGQEDDDGNSISIQKLGEKKTAGVPTMAQNGASPTQNAATQKRPQPTSKPVAAKVQVTT